MSLRHFSTERRAEREIVEIYRRHRGCAHPMPYGWGVNTPRTPLHLAALIVAALPDADIDRIEMGEAATQAGDTERARARDTRGRWWEVEAPLTPAASLSIESQRDVLINLGAEHRAGRLLANVPHVTGFATIRGGGRAMVYPRLPGLPIDESDLTDRPELVTSLARCLASLHALRTSVVTSTGLPDYSAEDCLKRLHSDIDEAAQSGALSKRLFDRWEEFLDNASLWRFTPTVVHGSIDADAILAHEGTVTALTGFSAIHVGDPAQDFAWLAATLAPDQLDNLYTVYAGAKRVDTLAGLPERASFLSEIALVKWLLHGLRRHDEDVVADAKQLLADLDSSLDEAEAHREHELETKPEGAPKEPTQDDVATVKVDLGADER